MNPLAALLAAHPAVPCALTVLTLGLLLAAWVGHTDRSRAVALCVKGAIQAQGWTHDYIAAQVGMTRPEFDHALAGRKALSLHRLANLPDLFWAEFDKRRAGLRGAVVLEAPEVAFVRGAILLPKATMLQMTLPHARGADEKAS